MLLNEENRAINLYFSKTLRKKARIHARLIIVDKKSI